MSKPRIGIIGAGGMAAERARHFRSLAADVSGVYARNTGKARALCETLAAKAYESCDALIEASDALVICLPNALHTEHACKALKRGKHVLVEYPLCCSQEEMHAIIAQRGSDQVLMVGNTIIHEAPYMYVQNNKHRLGKLLSAGSRVSWHSQGINDVWFFKESLRGPLFAALHYHHIEYYRRLMGDVRDVWAHADSDLNAVGGTLSMTHDSGGVSVVQWHLTAEGSGLARGMWLTGTQASLSIVSQQPGRSHAIWNGGEQIDEILDDWGVAGSCADFLNAMNGKLDHAARLQEDIKTLRIAWSATRDGNNGASGQR